MKKNILSVILFGAIIASVSSCGGSGAASAPSTAAAEKDGIARPEFEIRIGPARRCGAQSVCAVFSVVRIDIVDHSASMYQS